ncbi:hypothetical protein [Streptomyces cyaneofuscatus]|uniref:hypothetical protein n=1 Tax=Streptomyces cyaneofuscatus TaxID=66883 RepID=UPI00365F57F0
MRDDPAQPAGVAGQGGRRDDALELEPKSAAGAPSGDNGSISRTMSSACVAGDWSVTGPSRGLRE